MVFPFPSPTHWWWLHMKRLWRYNLGQPCNVPGSLLTYFLKSVLSKHGDSLVNSETSWEAFWQMDLERQTGRWLLTIFKWAHGSRPLPRLDTSPEWCCRYKVKSLMAVYIDLSDYNWTLLLQAVRETQEIFGFLAKVSCWWTRFSN